MIELAILLVAAAFFLAALSAVIYVAYRFLLMALSVDAALLREFKATPRQLQEAKSTENVLGGQLREFIAARMKPTEGEFVGNTDEEMFIQEQIKLAEAQGMTAEEIKAFMSQAVTDKG
jgi:hypothetical protein